MSHSLPLDATSLPRTLRSKFNSVQEATSRMGVLLGNMVDLQNLQSGNIVSQTADFHPPTLLISLRDARWKQAAAAGVRLQVFANSQLPSVRGNAELLLKCLGALLDNAIKASQRGQRVVLRCTLSSTLGS